jgi:UDP-glucose 4-epimerase
MVERTKILVTGGAGYIGSHTVVELQSAGFEVYILDDLSNSAVSVIDSIENITGIRPHFLQLDLTIPGLVATFLDSVKIEGVIHFAASKAVGESVEKPLLYYRNNLGSLINLLSAMEANHIKNFVFSSSCTVYGQPDTLPVSESSPVKHPESPYGNTKKIGEEIISDTVLAYRELYAIALRYFNPIGAHHSALIGELPSGMPNNLVPLITRTAIGKRSGFQVYGNDYPTPDGTCIRDYIHVMDVAKAHVVALKRLISQECRERFEVFNLGTGTGYSVLDVIHTFNKVSGLNLPFQFAPRRPGDVTSVYADTSLANKELGWKAEMDLESMLSSSWEWEKYLKLISNES